MEAVPIRNCSTTLPPLTRGVQPSKRLCRKLFGPVDHEEIAQILDSELDRDAKEKSEEWCFNFSEGTPLNNGRLVWEEVKQRKKDELSTKSEEKVNEERRVPGLHGETESSDNDVFNVSKDDSVASTTQFKKSAAPAACSKSVNEMASPSTANRKRKKQYKTITDFMKQKKRRRVSHSSATDKSSHAKLANETLSTKDDIAVESPAKKMHVVN